MNTDSKLLVCKRPEVLADSNYRRQRRWIRNARLGLLNNAEKLGVEKEKKSVQVIRTRIVESDLAKTQMEKSQTIKPSSQGDSKTSSDVQLSKTDLSRDCAIQKESKKTVLSDQLNRRDQNKDLPPEASIPESSAMKKSGYDAEATRNFMKIKRSERDAKLAELVKNKRKDKELIEKNLKSLRSMQLRILKKTVKKEHSLSEMPEWVGVLDSTSANASCEPAKNVAKKTMPEMKTSSSISVPLRRSKSKENIPRDKSESASSLKVKSPRSRRTSLIDESSHLVNWDKRLVDEFREQLKDLTENIKLINSAPPIKVVKDESIQARVIPAKSDVAKRDVNSWVTLTQEQFQKKFSNEDDLPPQSVRLTIDPNQCSLRERQQNQDCFPKDFRSLIGRRINFTLRQDDIGMASSSLLDPVSSSTTIMDDDWGNRDGDKVSSDVTVPNELPTLGCNCDLAENVRSKDDCEFNNSGDIASIRSPHKPIYYEKFDKSCNTDNFLMSGAGDGQDVFGASSIKKTEYLLNAGLQEKDNGISSKMESASVSEPVNSLSVIPIEQVDGDRLSCVGHFNVDTCALLSAMRVNSLGVIKSDDDNFFKNNSFVTLRENVLRIPSLNETADEISFLSTNAQDNKEGLTLSVPIEKKYNFSPDLETDACAKPSMLEEDKFSSYIDFKLDSRIKLNHDRLLVDGFKLAVEPLITIRDSKNSFTCEFSNKLQPESMSNEAEFPEVFNSKSDLQQKPECNSLEFHELTTANKRKSPEPYSDNGVNKVSIVDTLTKKKNISSTSSLETDKDSSKFEDLNALLLPHSLCSANHGQFTSNAESRPGSEIRKDLESKNKKSPIKILTNSDSDSSSLQNRSIIKTSPRKPNKNLFSCNQLQEILNSFPSFPKATTEDQIISEMKKLDSLDKSLSMALAKSHAMSLQNLNVSSDTDICGKPSSQPEDFPSISVQPSLSDSSQNLFYSSTWKYSDQKRRSNKANASRQGNMSKFSLKMFENLLKEEELRFQEKVALLEMRKKIYYQKMENDLTLLSIERMKLKKRGKEEALRTLKKRERGIILKLRQDFDEVDKLLKEESEASRIRKLMLKRQINLISMQLNMKMFSQRLGNRPHSDVPKKTETGKTTIKSTAPNYLNSSAFDEIASPRKEKLDDLAYWNTRVGEEERRLRDVEKYISRRNQTSPVCIDRGTSPLNFNDGAAGNDHKVSTMQQTLQTFNTGMEVEKSWDYNSDSFELPSPSENINSALASARSVPEGRRKTFVAIKVPLSPRTPNKRRHSSGSDESMLNSHNETSEASDLELRVGWLHQELRRKKTELDQIKKQHLRSRRERLKTQEQSLISQINALSTDIEKLKNEIKQEMDLGTFKVVRPLIKQPRASESKSVTVPAIPVERKSEEEIVAKFEDIPIEDASGKSSSFKEGEVSVATSLDGKEVSSSSSQVPVDDSLSSNDITSVHAVDEEETIVTPVVPAGTASQKEIVEEIVPLESPEEIIDENIGTSSDNPFSEIQESIKNDILIESVPVSVAKDATSIADSLVDTFNDVISKDQFDGSNGSLASDIEEDIPELEKIGDNFESGVEECPADVVDILSQSLMILDDLKLDQPIIESVVNLEIDIPRPDEIAMNDEEDGNQISEEAVESETADDGTLEKTEYSKIIDEISETLLPSENIIDEEVNSYVDNEVDSGSSVERDRSLGLEKLTPLETIDVSNLKTDEEEEIEALESALSLTHTDAVESVSAILQRALNSNNDLLTEIIETEIPHDFNSSYQSDTNADLKSEQINTVELGKEYSLSVPLESDDISGENIINQSFGNLNNSQNIYNGNLNETFISSVRDESFEINLRSEFPSSDSMYQMLDDSFLHSDKLWKAKLEEYLKIKEETPFLTALHRESIDVISQQLFNSCYDEAITKVSEIYLRRKEISKKDIGESIGEIQEATDGEIDDIESMKEYKLFEEGAKAREESFWHDEAASSRNVIAEKEKLRLEQLRIEQEIENLEAQALGMRGYLLREIPNKPPPPYVPPVRGRPKPNQTEMSDAISLGLGSIWDSLMSSDSRHLGDSVVPAPDDFLPDFTNHPDSLFRDMVWDMCRELYSKLFPPPEPEHPPWVVLSKRMKLTPPPRSREELIRWGVKQSLIILGYEPAVRKENMIIRWSRKKRDRVDEILVKESQEEEAEWTNYSVEENVLKNTISDQIVEDMIAEAADAFSKAFLSKIK